MKEKIINIVMPITIILILLLFILAVGWDFEETVYEFAEQPWALVLLLLTGGLYICLYAHLSNKSRQ